LKEAIKGHGEIIYNIFFYIVDAGKGEITITLNASYIIIIIIIIIIIRIYYNDCLCGLVVRVLGYRSGGPGSIPGTTRKKKYCVWNGVHSAS
jgi:hypothetical protein